MPLIVDTTMSSHTLRSDQKGAAFDNLPFEFCEASCINRISLLLVYYGSVSARTNNIFADTPLLSYTPLAINTMWEGASTVCT